MLINKRMNISSLDIDHLTMDSLELMYCLVKVIIYLESMIFEY